MTTRVLADDVVALSLDSPEQLDGTRSVLRSLTPLTSLRTDEPVGLHFVLARVEGRAAEVGSYALTDAEREQIDRVRIFLREPADPLRATLSVERVHLLHHEPTLTRSEFLALGRTRVLDATALHVDYLRIARRCSATRSARWLPALSRRRAIQTGANSSRSSSRARATSPRHAARALRGESSGPQPGGNLAERVAELRVVADRDPTRRPDLAASLKSLATAQSEVGLRDDALATITEAVDLYRELAQANPAAYTPDLALSLNNLANRQSQAGLRDDALATLTEAVDLRRALAQANPAVAFTPDLAMSLNNLANMQSEVGLRDDALASITEAVDLYRELAQANPAAFTPDLAGSLNNLATMQSEVGLRDDALAAITEAVDLLRELAQAHHLAYTPDLATSLTNMGHRLSETGAHERAFEVTLEAVQLRRRFAEQVHAAGRPQLASSLRALAARHEALGDRAAAAAALEESERITAVLLDDAG